MIVDLTAREVWVGYWFLREEPRNPQPRFVNMASGLAACGRAPE